MLTFSDYKNVVVSTDKSASYKIDGITLKYEVVNNENQSRRYFHIAL